MREIVVDTETTGLDPRDHRIVEIGCLELVNHVPTGRTFHTYVNPERDMPEDARRVHGLSAEFLRDKPLFCDVAEELLEFLADDLMVIHNAPFDLGFLDAEFGRSGRPVLSRDRVVDTLEIARRKHPAASCSLDALCRRYNIDNSMRVRHGALLDAELLAEVYLELIGGRQPDLALTSRVQQTVHVVRQVARVPRRRPRPLASRLTEEERAAHAAFVATLGDHALWLDRQA